MAAGYQPPRRVASQRKKYPVLATRNPGVARRRGRSVTETTPGVFIDQDATQGTDTSPDQGARCPG